MFKIAYITLSPEQLCQWLRNVSVLINGLYLEFDTKKNTGRRPLFEKGIILLLMPHLMTFLFLTVNDCFHLELLSRVAQRSRV